MKKLPNPNWKGVCEMARTSKRLRTGGNGKENGVSARKEKYWKAGIYARLSSNQDERKNESVEVQIDMANKFVDEWNAGHNDKIEVAECYIDMGKTGTNFNRDEFKRLMQDVRIGEINCVIVKDLSRFGRNYLDAGNYIEKIFPFLGVRFIAVSDGYDTGADGNHTKQMASEIKNLVNDMYAKDFSKKAKIHLQQRRKEGSYVGGPPPYGYIALWDGKIRKLVPDENTKEIVRYIYGRFIELESYKAVTDDLNRRRINRPSVYKKTGEVYCPPECFFNGWDKGSVERILKSETYLGKLVQGKTSITARNESSRIHKTAEEWIVAEHTHEALIERDVFEKAAEVRNQIRLKWETQNSPSEGYPIEENIFDKVLFCGVCGKKMTRTSYVKHYENGDAVRMDGYLCGNSVSTKTEVCVDSNRISKNKLVDILFVVLDEEFSMNFGKQKIYVEQGREYIIRKKQELEQKQHLTERAIFSLREEDGRQYIDYRKGNLSQKDYVAVKMQSQGQRQQLEKQKEALEKAIKDLERNGENYLRAIRSLLKWKKKKEITKELVETLIEKIYVYPGRRIEVLFLYRSAITKVVKR